MKSKGLYLFHALIIMAVAWGVGYSQARGQVEPQEPSKPKPAMAFTYQGSLKQGGSAVNATCDFQFGLWDEQSLGTQIGVTQTLSSAVSGGLFSVQLNGGGEFAAQPFDGNERWLAVAVRCPAGSGSYTSLAPQELTATPLALFSKESAVAAQFSGSLAGDVTGTQSSTTVTKLQGNPIASTAPTSEQVLKYDGSQWAPGMDDSANYQGLVIVAKSGGDYTSIQTALDSITTASDMSRYLVKVMPGVYTETVTMKQYVDIEGSGELTTRITSPGSSSWYSATLTGANNTEVRFLTVENTGGADYATAIFNYSTSPRLRHITAIARDGDSTTGIRNFSSSAIMTDVTVSASYGNGVCGIDNTGGAPVMVDVTVHAFNGFLVYGVYNSLSGGNYPYPPVEMTAVNVIVEVGYTSFYGIYNYDSNVVVQNSIVNARQGGVSSNGYGIYNIAMSESSAIVEVNHSQVKGVNKAIFISQVSTLVGSSLLNGGVQVTAGSVTCAGVYDENYTFYTQSCP